MANNDLRIIIQATLDEAKSTKAIQEQLKSLQSNLNITIGIDAKQVANIADQVKSLQNQVAGKQIKIIDDTTPTKFFSDIDAAVKEFSKLGNVNIAKTINPANQELEKFVLTLNKADGTVERLNFEMAKLGNVHGIDGYYLKTQNILDKTSEIREKQLQQEHNINKQIQEQNQKLQSQIDLYQREAQIKAKDLRRRYGNEVDEGAISGYLAQVRSLNAEMPNARQKMSELDMSFREISSSVRSSSSHVLGFGEALQTAMVNDFAV